MSPILRKLSVMQQLELGLALVQPAHAELPEPQDILDPAVGRLGNLWWSSFFGQCDKFFSCRLMLESNGFFICQQ